jgi:hypothetical protein
VEVDVRRLLYAEAQPRPVREPVIEVEAGRRRTRADTCSWPFSELPVPVFPRDVRSDAEREEVVELDPVMFK